MPVSHTTPTPSRLPFHAESFEWLHFERFCLAYFVAGISLPNFGLLDNTGVGPGRLRVIDAKSRGTAGAKQLGIDFELRMETGAIWVVQCKRKEKFGKDDAEKAINKAETEYGSRHPAKYLLWVTGKVSPDALDVAASHRDWTLWDGERISNEFLLHTPRPQALRVITASFGTEWAKAFFPLPDDLLITPDEFFARWLERDRLFNHRAELVGRQDLLDDALAFARGGSDCKALILSARGGIGKTRLLRALATRLEDEGRLVRFTNPLAQPEDRPPRDEDFARMTVIHDDAHRIETLSKLLIGILANKETSTGSRLVLATRPGAEDALRERLMQFGYESRNIATKTLGPLRKVEMEKLAAERLGADKAHFANPLASISGGCALVTLIGAELLKRGEIAHLDLTRSAEFCSEVFTRFEGQELSRVSGNLEKPLLEKLLRSIALLAPWDDRQPAAFDAMAGSLGIQRGPVQSACESLEAGGLLMRSRAGLRITPDLFSDHLVYVACYVAAGRATPFIQPFLDAFLGAHSQVILANLAEAEWRAQQQHGADAASVIEPVWQGYLQVFDQSPPTERARLMAQWAERAAYQPERSIALAERALEMCGTPSENKADEQRCVVLKIAPLLKPVAIWSKDHRHAALDVIWRSRRDFPWIWRDLQEDRFVVFAEIASFEKNYPDAPSGVLDWLKLLLAREDAALVTDKPCGLLDRIIRPFFAQAIERTFMPDKRRFSIQTIPLSVSKTKAIRHRALALLTEQVIPRGTVAAMNALPALAELFRGTSTFHGLSDAEDRAWRPERRLGLEAIGQIAERHPHPLIHYAIRHQLHWHIVHDRDVEDSQACTALVAGLPDTFELRLARLTLSSMHDDFLEPSSNPSDQQKWSGWLETGKAQWASLQERVTLELLRQHSSAPEVHGYLAHWCRMCNDHGLVPRLGGLFGEIARQRPDMAFDLLDCILTRAQPDLAGSAASLVPVLTPDFDPRIGVALQRGICSDQPAIAMSFLGAVLFVDALATHSATAPAMLKLAERATGDVLNSLIGVFRCGRNRDWEPPLLLTLLDRKLSDEETSKLADALGSRLRYGDGRVDDQAIGKLLDRLLVSRDLNYSRHDMGFLNEVAKRQPRQVFDFFFKRIERQAIGGKCYSAMPWRFQSLRGLENDPEHESLARDLFRRAMDSKGSEQFYWQELFSIAVTRISPLGEELIVEHLPKTTHADEIDDLVSLMNFEGSLLIFTQPQLTEAILRKARSFGTEAHKRITWSLIHGSGPRGRGYTNGELDPQYRYLREEAEKAARTHESNPILAPFYQKIVEMEVREAERHRKEMEDELADDW